MIVAATVRRLLGPALIVAALAGCGATPPQPPLHQTKKLGASTGDISTECGLAYIVTAFPGAHHVELLKLETRPSEKIRVPRLAAPPVAMECRFRQCLEFGETRSRLIVGEVVMFHIRNGLLNNGKVETAALDPIARVGGPRYARLGDIVTQQSVFQTPKSTD